MNIIKYLEDKRNEILKYETLTTEDRIELDVVSEILLYSQLNPDVGKVKFKTTLGIGLLEADLNLIVDNGGVVLDVQLTSAAPGISVSAGDRAASMYETRDVEVIAVIKYLEK